MIPMTWDLLYSWNPMSLRLWDYYGNYFGVIWNSRANSWRLPCHQVPALQTSASWGGGSWEEEAAGPEFRTKAPAEGLLWISKAATFSLLFQDNSQEAGFFKFFHFCNHWESGRTNRTREWKLGELGRWEIPDPSVLIGSWVECTPGQKNFCFPSPEQSLMMGVEHEISREKS